MTRTPPSPEDIRAALDRVTAGSTFAGARRSADFLRYIVDAALKSPGRQIKEHELGAEALGRGDRFDPRLDPIARVEASRLRGRLAQYYAAEGVNDPVRIEVPKGGYTPVFSAREAPKGIRKAAVWQGIAAFVAGVVMAAVVAGAIVFANPDRTPEAAQRTAAFDVALGAPGVLADQVGNSLAVSPDGRTLAMHVITEDSSSRLFVRRIDELEARELPGTTGASSPFFSPDGAWVGFLAGNRLRKTRTDGSGSPITLAEAPDLLGASWSEGEIVASLGSRKQLLAVPEEGGEPRAVLDAAEDDADVLWPDVLPGGRGFVFASVDRREGRYSIEAARMNGSGRRVIARSGTYPRYAAGHVFYVDGGTLFALPFDAGKLEPGGEPRPLVSDVAYRDGFGYAFYDVSDAGDLVYLRGSGGLATIERLEGGDKSSPLIAEPGRYLFPRLSPDGRKLAYAIAEGPVQVMHVRDLESGTSIKLGAGDASETFPVWSPEGRRLYLQLESDMALGWRNADGSGEAHALIPGVNVPRSLSPKGDRIAFHHLSEGTHFDIWTASLGETASGPNAGVAEVFLATNAIETYPALSPDGRWIAYASNEGGDFELFVSPFPEGGRKVKLGAAGRVAVWSPARQEIFFATNDHRLMVQPYTIQKGVFTPGRARQWSAFQLADTGVYYNFDVAPDGRSVVALVPLMSGGARARDHFTMRFNVLAVRSE